MTTHQKKHIKHVNVKELIIRDKNKDEFYGITIEPKGDARFEVKIIENNYVTIAKIAGRLIKGPKKQKINKEDYVLIQKTDNKYYIIHKYTKEDVKKLKKTNEILSINNNLTDGLERTSSNIVFEDEINDNIKNLDIDEEFISAI